MKYAHIVINLPIDTHFDYLVPKKWEKAILVGSRVWVNFREKKLLGIVSGLSSQTKIKKIKPILELIDHTPILSPNMLNLTRQLADYYCSSWGEAIYTALPNALREGKAIKDDSRIDRINKRGRSKFEVTLIRDLEGNRRWNFYITEIKKIINSGKEVIFLSADITAAFKAQNILKDEFGDTVLLLKRSAPSEESIKQYLMIFRGEKKIIIGLRSSIFAPFMNLGLVIIDDEEGYSFKQEQGPFYHARNVALMRAKIEKAKLILASHTESLESYYAASKKKCRVLVLERKKQPPLIRIVDLHREIAKKRTLISTFLENEIRQVLEKKGKVGLFLNRRGFALFCRCQACGFILRCQRCSSNLIYEFSKKKLICRLCNYKIDPIELCPQCKNSYIKYLGAGREKLESELHRLFPVNKIQRLDKDIISMDPDADILIFSQNILNKGLAKVIDLLGVISADTLLNQIDYRSSEKTFSLLWRLINLDAKKIIVQTYIPWHYIFKSLLNLDQDYFYKMELKNRKELGFPPFNHIITVILRAKDETIVKKSIARLFDILKKTTTNKAQIFSPLVGMPAKLRGNFRWEILLKTKDVEYLNSILKKTLKNFWHSGIIVSVDVDPN